MRKSRWIISKDFSINKKSKRFIVRIDGSKYELSSNNYELLVIFGDGEISSDALMLAEEEDVNIVVVDDDLSLCWFSGFSKGIEYLLNQIDAVKYGSYQHIILNTYILNGFNFLSEIGYSVEKEIVNYLIEIEDYEKKYLEAFQRLETISKSILSVEYSIEDYVIDNVVKIYYAFLKAEILSSIIFSGLSPYIGFIDKKSLYNDVALEFRFPIVWETLKTHHREIKEYSLPKDIDEIRNILRFLKDKLETVSNYHGISFREILRRRTRLMASSIVNPTIKYTVEEWFQ